MAFEQLNVRVSPGLKNRIAHAVEQAGTTQAAWIIAAIDEKLKRETPAAKPPAKKAAPAALRSPFRSPP